MKVYLENVRCFGSPVEANIKPLSILVGENSTGKSTFLAAYAAVVGSASGFPLAFNLNIPPFELGNLDTFATLRKGKSGRAKSVTLGYDTRSRASDKNGHKVRATFIGRGGSTQLSLLYFEDAELSVSLTIAETGQVTLAGTWRGSSFNRSVEAEVPSEVMDLGSDASWLGMHMLFRRVFDQVDRLPSKSEDERKVMSSLARILLPFSGPMEPLQAIAPLRAKPKRTYDVVSDKNAPEGDDLPQMLADCISKDEEAYELLRKIGKESGLFNDLSVRHLGKKSTDPVQVVVEDCAGNKVNLADVGYGVSQVLPILMHCIRKRSTRAGTLLLQQPEVHLHPRAQAALGNLLVRASLSRTIIVETHSDYLIDRVRQEVRKGRVKPTSVAILFFEKGKDTTIHQIELDKHGDPKNPPDAYRAFFLEEELRNLS